MDNCFEQTLHWFDPDDPPFPVLGLPRIVSTESNIQAMLQAVPNVSLKS